jgi:hypothetical protein
MRAYQEKDFDQMAQRVVDRFMSGEKLADMAAMEAQQGQLNPDQVARLVQAANTMAFLRLMEQQKQQGVPDMTGEFDPIDPRQVLQHIMGGVDLPHEEPPHAEPDGDEGPLPNEIGEGEAMMASGQGGEPKGEPPIDDDNDGPFPKGEKQKSKDDDGKKDKPEKKEPPKESKKDEAKEAAFRGERRRKFASVLEDQYKQAEWLFEDTFGALERSLSRAWGGPSLEAFEKDAMALRGDAFGAVVLNLVRESRRLPPLTHEDICAKHAALVDRHLVTENEATRLFEKLASIAAEADKLRRGAEFVRIQCS